jgi:hypothetical protein
MPIGLQAQASHLGWLTMPIGLQAQASHLCGRPMHRQTMRRDNGLDKPAVRTVPRMAMSPGSGWMLPSARRRSCAVVSTTVSPAAPAAGLPDRLAAASALTAALAWLPALLPALPRRRGMAPCVGVFGVLGRAACVPLGASGREQGADCCGPPCKACLAAAHASCSDMRMGLGGARLSCGCCGDGATADAAGGRRGRDGQPIAVTVAAARSCITACEASC